MASTLNDMMGEVTKEVGVDFLDLRGVFEADYARNGRSFNFRNDYHWNEYAHELVAGAIHRHVAALDDRVLSPR